MGCKSEKYFQDQTLLIQNLLKIGSGSVVTSSLSVNNGIEKRFKISDRDLMDSQSWSCVYGVSFQTYEDKFIYWEKLSRRNRSSHQRCSIKRTVLKNFAIFTGTLLEKDSNTGVFL